MHPVQVSAWKKKEGCQFLSFGRGFRDVLAVADDEQVSRLHAADDGLAVHMRKGGGLRLPGLAAIGRVALRDFFLAAREYS